MLPTTMPQRPVLFPNQAARMNRKGREMVATPVVPIDPYYASMSDPAEMVHRTWMADRAAEVGTFLTENARKDAYMRSHGGPSRLGATKAEQSFGRKHTMLTGGVITDPAVRPQVAKLLERRKAEYEQLATAQVDAPGAPALPAIPLQSGEITAANSSLDFISDALASLNVDGIVGETRKFQASLMGAAQILTPDQLQNYYAALDDLETDAKALVGRVAGPQAVDAKQKRQLKQFIRESQKTKKIMEQLARAAYSSGAERQLMVENIRRQQGLAVAAPGQPIGQQLQLGVPVTEQRPILVPQPTGQGRRYKKKVHGAF